MRPPRDPRDDPQPDPRLDKGGIAACVEIRAVDREVGGCDRHGSARVIAHEPTGEPDAGPRGIQAKRVWRGQGASQVKEEDKRPDHFACPRVKNSDNRKGKAILHIGVNACIFIIAKRREAISATT